MRNSALLAASDLCPLPTPFPPLNPPVLTTKSTAILHIWCSESESCVPLLVTYGLKRHQSAWVLPFPLSLVLELPRPSIIFMQGNPLSCAIPSVALLEDTEPQLDNNFTSATNRTLMSKSSSQPAHITLCTVHVAGQVHP